ncbi:MAG TPA: MFS transporter [Thermoanaerobaculia bacterium]|nr:MFS transporter [Thermoanaerobaculia bacterium]
MSETGSRPDRERDGGEVAGRSPTDPRPRHDADPDQEKTFRESVREYLDRRLLFIFLFGIASGYPWVLIASAMTLRLAHADVSRSAIGVFGMVTAAYAINFLWAPFVDRLVIPFLGPRLGARRAWILVTQVLLFGGTVGLAFADPRTGIPLLAASALLVAFSSATQDVAVDAYRIEVIPRHETAKISHAAAMTTAGWWTGFGMVGAIPFFLIDLPGWDWQRVYLLLAALWVPLMVAVLLAPRSLQRRDKFAEAEARYEAALGYAERPGAWKRVTAWLAVTVVEPLREFLVRVGPKLAWSVLLFVFFFKIGEAFLGRMSVVFYEEVGYTATQIGTYSKLLGAGSTIVFSLLSSIVNARLGLIRGLLIGGIAMAASNLMYSWIAWSGPVEWLYAATVLVDGFTAAFSTIAFVAFISYLTSHTYTATQYALLASLGNFGRTTMSGFSGFLVDWLDTVTPGGDANAWAVFFIITALMVIPSLLLLIYVRKHLRRKQREWEATPAAAG